MSAPLDLDAVRAALSGTGTMLPSAAYANEAVLAWERRVLFAGGWVCVGRSADVVAPRGRRAVAVGDEAVLLMRGEDSVLRGFFNTCRHRGHELLPCGAGDEGRFLTCPYHSWVYDLEGRLHKVPPAHRDALDAGDLSLVGVPVVEWQGFLFVNADAKAAPFESYVAGLDDALGPYGCERLVVAATHEYELAANWKLVVENYHECYHCSTIHPELCRVSPPDSGVDYLPEGLWLGGTLDLADSAETMSLSGRSGGVPLVNGPLEREVVYVHLFPNVLISAHPDYVMTHTLEPLAADRTRIVCQWLFPPEALALPGFDPSYAVDFWDLTNRQDWAACESVQRGVTSRGYRPGPLSPATEPTTYQAISLIASAYLEGRLPQRAPAPRPRRRLSE
jgi:phenylpropionate dioxygenase-like ring-hydroxylating dioxygenase large terminal subunit